MRLYKILLHLYPASFRAEYGDELARIFQQKRMMASGIFDLLILWLLSGVDVLHNAFGAHVDILKKDLSFWRRTIARTPGFAVTAILVTALGIGANTAVFSVVNHVLIRPLPYQDPERIVQIWQSSGEYSRSEVSPPNYLDWKLQSKSFQSMASYVNMASFNLVGIGLPEKINGALLSSEVLPLLGIRPLIGRTFTKQETQFGAPGTVLLSYELWQTKFGGDPRVIGRQIRMDDESFNIIGILPANISFPDKETRLWVPLRLSPEDAAERDNTYLKVIARLKNGISIDQARAEMVIIAKKLEQQYPEQNAKTSANVESLRDLVPKQSRVLLIALLGASICVLLIACTNLANLFLVRAFGRQKELAVRAALGAGRERLVRQLLTESLLFAFSGGIIGVALAYAALPLLGRLIPDSLPIGQPTVLDIRVLTFAAAMLIVTALLSGVVPFLRAFKKMDTGGLHEGSRSGIGGRREQVRSGLVLAEVAASVVLLIASGLLIRALHRVQSIDPGFKTGNVLTMETRLPLPKYGKTLTRVDFYTRVLDAARALPGVHSAAYISFLPMVGRGGIWAVQGVDGRELQPGENLLASIRFISPGFFDSMGIPVRAGRDVQDSDTADAQAMAVISESLAKELWPNQDPIGKHFKFAFEERTVVGVVGDIRFRGLERSSEPQVYLSYRQVRDNAIIGYIPKALVIRSSVDSGSLISSIRSIVSKADPEIPISNVRTLENILDDETIARRTQIRILLAFASLSLLLAGIGIHGLLAFSVSQRTSEIGLRLALGAGSRDILKMIVERAFQIAVIGTVVGLLLAYMAGRLMQALLAGVPPADPLTVFVVCALALIATLTGCLVPAVRALRIDPAFAVRVE